MKVEVDVLVKELRPALVAVGVSERQLGLLDGDDLDFVGIYNALISLKTIELPHYAYAVSLVPQSMWDYYTARGINYLRECKIRSEAERDLRRAFKSRVAIFTRGKHASKQEAAAIDSEGESLRSSSTG